MGTDVALALSAQTFLLVFTRVAGLLASGPFFGGRSVPGMFKAGATLFVTLLVLPLIPQGSVQLPSSLLAMCLLVLREVAVGVAAGLLAQLVFSAVQLAGELMGLQMGFSMINLVDPSTGVIMPVIAQLYGLFATLLFFLLDAHHIFVRGLFMSFQLAPVGTTGFNPLVAASLTEAVGRIFVMALELSAPVMAALFLADVALGLVARTIPQMNVFTVGFPVKIVLGLAALAATLPLLASVMERQFGGLDLALRQLLAGM